MTALNFVATAFLDSVVLILGFCSIIGYVAFMGRFIVNCLSDARDTIREAFREGRRARRQWSE